MGWSGYNALMQNSGVCDRAGAGGYNETTFLQTAAVLKSKGLAAKGYVYLNSDDCCAFGVHPLSHSPYLDLLFTPRFPYSPLLPPPCLRTGRDCAKPLL